MKIPTDEETLKVQLFDLMKTIREKDTQILVLQTEKEELLKKYNIEPLTGKILIPKWIEADFKGIEAQISELYHTMNLIVTRINMNQYKQPIDNIAESTSLFADEKESIDWER